MWFHSQDRSSCSHWSLIFQIQKLRPKSAGSGDPGNGAWAPWSPGASLVCDHHCVCLAPDSGLWMLSCGCTALHSSCSQAPHLCWIWGVHRPASMWSLFRLWPSLPVFLASALAVGGPSVCSLPLPQASVLDFPPPLTTVRDPRLAASEILRPAGVSSHPGCPGPSDSGSLCLGLSSLPHPV